ncbi:meiotically up-regulated gene 113-domain-containing protein, partial [Syncephalastrum racemosum]
MSLLSHLVFQKKPWYLCALGALLPSAKHRRWKSSSTREPVLHQCRGIRAVDGKQCNRKIKTPNQDVDQDTLYCFSHRKRPTFDNGLGSERRATASWPELHDCWNLWVPQDISTLHQEKLRREMKKPVSMREQFGYIYIYALARGPKIQSSKYAYFKVGRSTDPLKRMYRISQSCKYEPAIIDVMPTLHSGYQCPASHRVERLIHLELDARFNRAKFQCHECHTEHREWFRIKRPEICTGVYMGDD